MDLTRDWLQNVLRPYPSRERIVPEVIDTLTARKSLAVKTEAFTFDTGHTALLLLLHGTLPILYRGATYHIPIHIWVPHEYPRSAPLAFVVPTKDMGVRKGKEVDPGGRVREEVVEAWWAQDNTIEGLLRQLTAVFSAAPPVYAKPVQPAQPAPSPAPVPAQASSSRIPTSQPPPPPARPYQVDQPLPQYRPQGDHSRQGSLGTPTSPTQSQSPQVPLRPYQASPAPIPPRPFSTQGPMPVPQPAPASIPGPVPVPVPVTAPVQVPAAAQRYATPQPRVQSPQQAPSPRVDLLSDDESESRAPPPPPTKPPPPSMLHLHSILLPHLEASLPPLIHSLQSNRQHLLERKEDLESGEPAVRDEMARLEAVKKVCDSVGRKMEDVVARGEDRVAELEQKGEVSVDEVVCGISIVHNQLIDLVAEDNALEDTIYHMTRALDNERIDLDRFLKSIRSLAREQYMKRALIERILQGMGQTQW